LNKLKNFKFQVSSSGHGYHATFINITSWLVGGRTALIPGLKAWSFHGDNLLFSEVLQLPPPLCGGI